jgi:hypothetical protein
VTADFDTEGVGQVKPGSEEAGDGEVEEVGTTGGTTYDDPGDELAAEEAGIEDATEDAGVEEGDGKYTSNDEPAVDAADGSGGKGTTG